MIDGISDPSPFTADISRAFLSLPFASRVTLLNRVVGKRLWSHQLAAAWLSILEWTEREGIVSEQRYSIARELVQLAPDSDMADEGLKRILATPVLSGDTFIQIIVSCRKNQSKAELLRTRIDGALGRTLVVVGESTLQHAIYNPNHTLIVPSPDNYESLTKKVMEAFVAVRRQFGSVGILKMDDDCRVCRPPDQKALSRAVANEDYVGEPCGNVKFDRTWHIGKCESLSPPVYGLRFRRSWARGALYYVGPRGVDALVRFYLRYPGEFDAAFYEDKCVGDTLSECGYSLKPHPLYQETGLISSYEVPPAWPARQVSTQHGD